MNDAIKITLLCCLYEAKKRGVTSISNESKKAFKKVMEVLHESNSKENDMTLF